MPLRFLAGIRAACRACAISRLTRERIPANVVAGPSKPGEKTTTFMFRILPSGETVADAPK
jgi:hypothetical protein